MNQLSKSLIVLFYCIFSVASALGAVDGPPDDALATGIAQPHDRDAEGYTEYYFDDPAADDLRARYYAQDGRAIAHKRLRFTGAATLPLFEMHDYRNSTGYRVLPQGNRLRIQTLRLLDNNYQAVIDVREIAVVEPTVVDAGFHRFLLRRWEAISAGESVRFNFVLVNEARLVPMIVRSIECTETDQLCVQVVVSNLLHRVFIPPVLLTYDRTSRRLLHYSGYGPLATETGRALSVTLNYQYKD